MARRRSTRHDLVSQLRLSEGLAIPLPDGGIQGVIPGLARRVVSYTAAIVVRIRLVPSSNCCRLSGFAQHSCAPAASAASRRSSDG